MALLGPILACTKRKSPRYVRLEATQFPCMSPLRDSCAQNTSKKETSPRFELSLASRPWLIGRHGGIQFMPIGIRGKFRLPEWLFTHGRWGFLRQMGLEFGFVSDALTPTIYLPLVGIRTTGRMAAAMMPTAPPGEEAQSC
ncbi:hypothetical protein LTR47_010222 [Exophiala xenobiotica]|nr:hypothetical protein LTR47_010222 [Exophiala xenobiotica]KAK5348036.1 hypothetical protein LTR61_008288 [Exophiala xenobiotica]KAK5361684.1 hypothetical protein LTS03_010307 [Exophiala xenobiotica]KAK5378657.1 hypothetical protein LTR11_004352 [Exophiala xenobiotica]